MFIITSDSYLSQYPHLLRALHIKPVLSAAWEGILGLLLQPGDPMTSVSTSPVAISLLPATTTGTSPHWQLQAQVRTLLED